MGIGIEMGRAMMRQKSAQQQEQEREAQRVRQEKQDAADEAQRAIQMATMEAALLGNGVARERADHRLTLPGLSVQETPASQQVGPRPQRPPDTAPVETGILRPGLQRLGSSGFVQDPTQTRAAVEARQAQTDAATKQGEVARVRTSRLAALRALYPTASPDELTPIAEDEVAFRQAVADRRRPDPVAQFKAKHDYRVENPAPSRSREPQSRRDPNIITLERQISEAERELTRLDTAIGKAEGAVSPSPAQQKSLTTLRQRADLLTQRRDSLRGERDSRAGAQMGAPVRSRAAAQPQTASLPPLDAARKARARNDEGYAAFLKRKGYSVRDMQ